MAEKKEVLKIKVQLENAQTIQELEEVLEHINDELGKVEEGSEAFEELQSMATKATKELDGVNKSVERLNGQTSVLEAGMEGLNQVTEMFGVSTGKLTSKLKAAKSQVLSLAGGMRATTAATGKTSMALKLLRGAIMATGIGALVIAIVSLISYFTKTQKGADMVSKAMSGLGAVVDVIIDRFSKVGEGLLALFRGDFSEAAGIFSDAMSGIGKEIADEAKAAWDLEAALQALEDKEISLIETQAKRRAEISKLQLQIEQHAENRTKAAGLIRQAMKMENAIANENIAIAKEKARIINAQLALGESTRDEMREAAQANAEVIAMEGERDMRLRELQGRLRGFTAVQKEATEAVKEHKKEYRDITDSEEEALDDEVDPELQKFLDRGQAIMDFQNYQNAIKEEEAERHAEAMVAYEDWRIKKVQELEASSAQIRKQLAMELYGNLVNMAQGFFKDNEAGQKRAFEFNKAIQTAETIATTYLAAQKAYASQIIPGDPTSLIRAKIAAGIAIASGLARVASIQNTKFNSTSVQSTTGGGGSVGSSPEQPRNVQPIVPIIDTESGRRETKVIVTETDIRNVTDDVKIILQKATMVE